MAVASSSLAVHRRERGEARTVGGAAAAGGDGCRTP